MWARIGGWTMLFGMGWVWWVLAAAAGCLVVRVAAQVAAVARAVRGDPPAEPDSPGWWFAPILYPAPSPGGWFAPTLHPTPSPGWLLLTGVAVAAVGYAVFAGLVFPDDPDLARQCGSTAAVVGFTLGGFFEAWLATWTQYRLVPRLIARELPRCLDDLQFADTEDRVRAVRRLGRMQTHAAPAVEPLAEAARRDRSADVRFAAWETLSNLSLSGVEVPADLLPAGLRDPDPWVRAVAACHAVRELGRDGRRPPAGPPPEVLAALGEAVSLPDLPVGGKGQPFAEVSARALAVLGPFAAPAIPALRAAVVDRTPPNLAAVEALASLKAAAVPVLTEMLAHPDPAVRRAAADGLGTMGPAAKDAVPALRAMSAVYPEDRPFAEFAVELIEMPWPGSDPAR